jgi:SRSO17 transposase
VPFQTKPKIALDPIRRTINAGIRAGVMLADAGYGVDRSVT